MYCSVSDTAEFGGYLRYLPVNPAPKDRCATPTFVHKLVADVEGGNKQLEVAPANADASGVGKKLAT